MRPLLFGLPPAMPSTAVATAVARLPRQHGVGPDAEHRPVIPPKPADADELRIRAYLCRMGVVL